jgi:hypothetical protein
MKNHISLRTRIETMNPQLGISCLSNGARSILTSTNPRSLLRLICPLALLLALSASAQSYSIDWFKVAGGGGTSTNGQYSLSGTIGQHDAGGPLTGGSYSLTGGFWALFAVPTVGAPTLRIILTTTNTAVVSWPSPSTGWKLQQNLDLSTGAWVTPGEPVNDNGTSKFILVSPPTGNRFYRLSTL